jgi:hypothetical protein
MGDLPVRHDNGPSGSKIALATSPAGADTSVHADGGGVEAPASTGNGHQRGLLVTLFDRYDALRGLGGHMKQRASIGIALLALSHLAFANVSSALAQAGSIGGSIGKQEKSISGGEEADRPRAAPHPKPPAAKAQETSSDHSCGRIVGRWSWYRGNESVFRKDGSARHSPSGATGKWTCAGDTVSVVWSYRGTRRATNRITVSQDGNSIFVVSSWGPSIKFTGTRRGPE